MDGLGSIRMFSAQLRIRCDAQLSEHGAETRGICIPSQRKQMQPSASDLHRSSAARAQEGLQPAREDAGRRQMQTGGASGSRWTDGVDIPPGFLLVQTLTQQFCTIMVFRNYSCFCCFDPPPPKKMMTSKREKYIEIKVHKSLIKTSFKKLLWDGHQGPHL